MRIDTRFLNWGVFFIVAGAIPLAVQAGLLTADQVADWWRLWPLLIVAAGIGLLLRATSVAFLGGLLMAVIFGVLLGGVITAGGNVDLRNIACGSDRSTTPFATQTGSLGGGDARVELELNCGELVADTAPGTGWTVAGTSSDGDAPVIDASGDRLSVRSTQRGVSVPPFTENRDDWLITLPSATSMRVGTTVNAGSAKLNLGGSGTASSSTTVNAGDARIDLSGTPVQSVTMTVNAGSGSITFPDGSVRGSLTVNAGSIEFCVPDSVGLQLTTSDNVTGSNNYGDRGLAKNGNTWQSANWSTATNRITLSTTANLGSLALNPEEGCK